MKAAEFAKTHRTDADWVASMDQRGLEPVVLFPGQRGTYSGFSVTVLRHYHNGIYEVHLASGAICIDGSYFVPESNQD